MSKQYGTDLPGLTLHEVIGPAASAAATTNDQEYFGFVPNLDIEVTAVKWVPEEAFTGAATNYVTMSLRNLGTAGSGTTDMASLACSSTGVSVGAKTPLAITLSSTTANKQASAGEVLEWLIAPSGSGDAIPRGTLHVWYKFQ